MKEEDEVIDEYYSTMERKYISPSTGSTTETASFRTMVMETVRNNVNDVIYSQQQQLHQHHHRHKLSQIKQHWKQSSPHSSPTIINGVPMQQQQQKMIERDHDITLQQSTKDIQQTSAYYNNAPSSQSVQTEKTNDDSNINNNNDSIDDASKIVSPHIQHRKFIFYFFFYNYKRKMIGINNWY